MRRAALLLMSALMAACAADAGAPSVPEPRLTIEQLIDIRHPSDPVWSPDGTRVAFISDRAGVSNLHVSDAARVNETSPADPSRAVTSFDDGTVSGAFWSADGGWLYFVRGGDLWRVSPADNAPEAVWTTAAAESNIVPSPDLTRVAFVRGAANGNGVELWSRMLGSGEERRLVHDAHGIGSVSWSPDGAHVAYSAGARAIRHEQTPAYSGSKIIYTVTERTPGQPHVVSARGGAPVSIGTAGGGTLRWVDPDRLVLDRQSPDFRRRTIQVMNRQGTGVRTLYEDVDDKFWSIPGGAGPSALPSPDGKWIAFLSDRDGWDHLYVIPSGGGAAVQLTKGPFEVWRPSWSSDSTRLAFDANEAERPGTRHVGVVTIGEDPGRATVSTLTSGRGTNTAPL